MSYTVEIIMNSSGISCDRHGGNLHTKHGDSITWHSQDNKSCFILEFYSFNDNTGGPSGWPFQEAEPDWKKGVVECKGTVKKGTGVEYFKYTIYDQARTKQLDPIIIVDRN